MKIKQLLIYSPGAFRKVGHAYDYCDGLTKGFYKQGIKSTILGYSGPLRFASQVGVINSRSHEFKSDKTTFIGKLRWGVARFLSSLQLTKDLVNVTKEMNCYVLLETFEYLSLGIYVGRLHSNYSLILHDTNFNRKQSSSLAGLYKSISKFSLIKIIEHSDFCFVHGKAMKENLLSQIGQRFDQKVQVIPYGAPDPIIPSIQDKIQSKLELRFPTKQNILLSFGTLRKDKKFEPVAEAISNCEKNWIWIIAGPEGDLSYSEIKKIIDKHNIKDQVRIINKFIGKEEQKKYFLAADIGINLYHDYIRHESGTAQLCRTFNLPIIVDGPPDLIQYVEDEGVGWIARSSEEIAKVLLDFTNSSENEWRTQQKSNIYKLGVRNSWTQVTSIISKTIDQQQSPE